MSDFKEFDNPWSADNSEWFGAEKDKWLESGRVESNSEEQVKTRKVRIVITSREIGEGLVRAYPDSNTKEYIVPLYECYIEGKTESGIKKTEYFKVIRFGIQRDEGKNIEPKVVGLKDKQTHVLTWVNYMEGSWQVYGNWLIHEGAENPSIQAWGALGCVEVTGRGEWRRFNDVIRSLSGDTNMLTISRARTLSAHYEAINERPPLIVKE